MIAMLFLSVLTFGFPSKTGKELEVEDFTKSDHMTLLKVFSTMCGTCKMFQPEWLKLKKHIGDKLQVVEIDIDEPSGAKFASDIGVLDEGKHMLNV